MKEFNTHIFSGKAYDERLLDTNLQVAERDIRDWPEFTLLGGLCSQYTHSRMYLYRPVRHSINAYIDYLGSKLHEST